MITLLLAGLTQLACTTVNAAVNTNIAITASATPSADSLNHIIAVQDESGTLKVFASQLPWAPYKAVRQSTETEGSNIIASAIYRNTDVANGYIYYYAVSNIQIVDGQLVVVNSQFAQTPRSSTLDEQPIYLIDLNGTYSGETDIYYYNIAIYDGSYAWNGGIEDLSVWTNDSWTAEQKSTVAYFSNDLSEIGLQDIETIINEQLNATTSAGTQAQTISNQVNNYYTSYVNGEIDLTTLQTNLDSLASQLDELNNSSSATIADKIAINNSLTQIQLVQDVVIKDEIIQEMEQDLIVSESIQDLVDNRIELAQNTFTAYKNGEINQSTAITRIETIFNILYTYLQTCDSIADNNAINTAINAINGIKQSIANYSDLNVSVSDKAQNSDTAEMEYLENIKAETTDNIDSLKTKVDSSINQTQANEVKDQVITPLLQNTLIVKVLPIAALFMVLAVTLGFKYKL